MNGTASGYWRCSGTLLLHCINAWNRLILVEYLRKFWRCLCKLHHFFPSSTLSCFMQLTMETVPEWSR